MKVLLHPLAARGLRENDVAMLDVPAQDDLSRRLAAINR
jgi:hypothetical protein